MDNLYEKIHLALHLLDYVLIYFSLPKVFDDMMIFYVVKFYLFLRYNHNRM
jgi:hypothetical protein